MCMPVWQSRRDKNVMHFHKGQIHPAVCVHAYACEGYGIYVMDWYIRVHHTYIQTMDLINRCYIIKS